MVAGAAGAAAVAASADSADDAPASKQDVTVDADGVEPDTKPDATDTTDAGQEPSTTKPSEQADDASSSCRRWGGHTQQTTGDAPLAQDDAGEASKEDPTSQANDGMADGSEDVTQATSTML